MHGGEESAKAKHKRVAQSKQFSAFAARRPDECICTIREIFGVLGKFPFSAAGAFL